MGDIHRIEKLPPALSRIRHHESWPAPRPADEQIGVAVLDRSVLDRIADYSRSRPTGPSPGRIYLHRDWTSAPEIVWHDRWTLFVVERDPESEKHVYHHPHRVEVVDVTKIASKADASARRIVRDIDDHHLNVTMLPDGRLKADREYSGPGMAYARFWGWIGIDPFGRRLVVTDEARRVTR